MDELDALIEKLGAKKVELTSLALEETKGKTLIGTAHGETIFACMSLGSRFYDGFSEKVKYYHVLPHASELLRVDFYA